MPINDTCIYSEAVAGDNGVHNSAGQFWLSPDLVVAGPDGMGRATPGVNNTINIRVRKKSDCQVKGDTVLVDLYVGDPSLAMTPSSGVVKLTNSAGRPNGFVNPATLNPAGQIVPITWNPSGAGIEGPGHKCLIARSYPDSDSPPANTFNLPTDQHVVQHNICIIPCSSPCGQDVITVNTNIELAELVTLHATADINPTRQVLNAVAPLLRQVKDFKRLRRAEIPAFSFKLDDKLKPKVTRDTTKDCDKGVAPEYAVQVQLQPKQQIKFRFQTDLDKARFGDAFVFHLTHRNARKKVQGGLTIIAVRTRTKL